MIPILPSPQYSVFFCIFLTFFSYVLFLIYLPISVVCNITAHGFPFNPLPQLLMVPFLNILIHCHLCSPNPQ